MKKISKVIGVICICILIKDIFGIISFLIAFLLVGWNYVRELANIVYHLSYIVQFFFLYKFYKPRGVVYEFRHLSVRNICFSVCGGIFIYGIIITVLYLLNFDTSNAGETWIWLVERVLCAIIIAPIAEELFFRQWMISYLSKYNNGDILKMLISSLFFYLIHVVPMYHEGVLCLSYWRFDTFFAGIILYYVYVRTGRIQYCIIMHSVSNFLVNINDIRLCLSFLL